MMNFIFNSWNKKGFSKKANILILSAISVLVFSACKKADKFYLDAAPPENTLNVLISDTATINLQTERQVAVGTDQYSTQLLGSVNDPLFGRTTASVYTQLLLEKLNPGFDSVKTRLDSTVLLLKMVTDASKSFGNKNDIQTWKIYQLNAELNASAGYFSDSTIQTGALLGTYTGKVSDTVLRIKLNNVLGNLIVNAKSTELNDNISFTKLVNGIAIVPDSNTAKGKGAIVPFDFINATTGLMLYYNDSLSYHIGVGVSAVTFGHYSHDYRNTPVQKQLDNPNKQYTNAYAQSLSGLKVKVEFPHLENYVREGLYALNQAVLVLPLVDSVDYMYNDKYSPYIYLRGRDSSGKDNISYDFPSYQNTFDFSNIGRKYNLNITADVQNMLKQYRMNPSKKYYGFNLLMPTSSNVTLSQLILSTQQNHTTSKPRLILTFTKI